MSYYCKLSPSQNLSLHHASFLLKVVNHYSNSLTFLLKVVNHYSNSVTMFGYCYVAFIAILVDVRDDCIVMNLSS